MIGHRQAQPIPAPALWAGATVAAIALHMVVVHQGLLAMQAQGAVPPPVTVPQVEIMAAALSVTGQGQPVEKATAVSSQSLSATSTAERAQSVGASPASRPDTVASDRVAAITAAPVSTPAAAAATRSRLASTLSATPAAKRPATSVSSAAVSVLAPNISSAPVVAVTTPSKPVPVVQPNPDSAALRTTPQKARVAGVQPPVATAKADKVPGKVSPSKAASPTVVAAASAQTAPRQMALQPVAPAPEIAAQALAPVSPGKMTLAAIAPVEPVKANPPAAKADSIEGIAAPNPQSATTVAPTQTYQSVLDVLAQAPSPPCFAALPTLSDAGVFQLEAFAQTTADLAGFRRLLEVRMGQVPNTTMKPISAAQCAALSFISEGPSYPRFKLFFELENRVIKSGEALMGRIGNAADRVISFLVVDDEGKVQDLAAYLQPVSAGAHFAIPLALTGSPVETQQLLMAIATTSPLKTVAVHNGASAEIFFPALAAELRNSSQSEDVAIIAFSVQ